MKGWFGALVGFVIVGVLLGIAYVTQATWEGKARDRIPVFESMRDPMYEGPADKAPSPRFAVYNGETVWVLYDFRERGYWVCLMQMPDGRRGWGSCKALQRDESRP